MPQARLFKGPPLTLSCNEFICCNRVASFKTPRIYWLIPNKFWGDTIQKKLNGQIEQSVRSFLLSIRLRFFFCNVKPTPKQLAKKFSDLPKIVTSKTYRS